MGADEDGFDRPIETYCLDCQWSLAHDEVDSVEERSRRTLEHFLETGHTIESVGALPPSLPDRC